LVVGWGEEGREEEEEEEEEGEEDVGIVKHYFYEFAGYLSSR